MSEYKVTFSQKITPNLSDGINNIDVVTPPGKKWVLQSQNFIEETSQICWTWKKENIARPITIWKPEQETYSRIYLFSIDFTKPESWYVNSVQNTEAIIADGISDEFALAYGSGMGGAIVCLSRGYVTEEELIAPPGGSNGGYIPTVDINGATQTEREFRESSGGEYEIDYLSGKIKFFTPPSSGNTINISYYGVPSGVGPIIQGGPNPGKKWVINSAEVQLTSDVDMNDALLQNVIADVPIFDDNGNYVTTLVDYKLANDAVYKNIGNFLDYTYGSYPVIPPFGGARGLKKDTIILRWDYLASIELLSSLNMRMKVWTKHNRGFIGERATVTIYGVELDE